MAEDFDFASISPDKVNLVHVWAAMGVLLERTKCIPKLVTHDQCKARRAEIEAHELRATLNGERGDAAKAAARRFTIRVALLSAGASAVFTGLVIWLVQEVPKWTTTM